jgi:hypothetical protein
MKALKPNYQVRRNTNAAVPHWLVIMPNKTHMITKKAKSLWYVSGTYRTTLRDAIIHAAYGL